MDLPPPEHPKVPRWDLGLRWCFMEIFALYTRDTRPFEEV
jgi:hypothetical protein